MVGYDTLQRTDSETIPSHAKLHLVYSDNLAYVWQVN